MSEKETPITQKNLEDAGWEYMKWNGVTDDWYKQFASPTSGYSNCISVRFQEVKSKGADEYTVYLYLSNNHQVVPGCTTMEKLDELHRMFMGDESNLWKDRETQFRKHIEDLNVLLESARDSERNWRESWTKTQKELGKGRERITELQGEIARLKLYLRDDEIKLIEEDLDRPITLKDLKRGWKYEKIINSGSDHGFWHHTTKNKYQVSVRFKEDEDPEVSIFNIGVGRIFFDNCKTVRQLYNLVEVYTGTPLSVSKGA